MKLTLTFRVDKAGYMDEAEQDAGSGLIFAEIAAVFWAIGGLIPLTND